jgi:hypothetical protein
LILLAKSEIRAIHVRQAGENWVYQDPGRCENDFASSITVDERQVIAQSVAKRIRISPLIKKDFRETCNGVGPSATRGEAVDSAAELCHQHPWLVGCAGGVDRLAERRARETTTGW